MAVFVFGCYTGLFANTASAYHLEGAKWAVGAVPGVCCAKLYAQYAGIHYNQDYTYFDDGLANWSNSPAYVSYTVSSSSAIQLYDTFNSGVAWDGITIYYEVGGDFAWSKTTLNWYYIQSEQFDAAVGAAAHELGHVAGLDHTNGCVLMVPDTYTRWNVCGLVTPQQDDVNGIDAMY